MITNDELLTHTSRILNTNKTTSLMTLVVAGWDFNKDSDNQTSEVDEKVSQMLLQRVTSGVVGVPAGVIVEENIEVVEDETIQEVVTSSSDIFNEEIINNKVTLSSDIFNEEIINNKVTLSSEITQEEDSRYSHLMKLFSASKTIPAKRRNKDKLVEDILNIIIPVSPAGKIAGRVIKTPTKRKEVLELIDASVNVEVLASDLI
ncbi:hypothetical protein, partial [Empedobacter sp.]|uniref:hypothetical protein n=1 Tax=Empedobacter sp. TaxID=1927715 RepID=UPI0028ADB1A3